MTKGFFITFEGGEGAGKTTQISLLTKYLREHHSKEVVCTREPGGTTGAEEIRDLLVKGGQDRWDKLTELLLFSAARRDHLVKKILPTVQSGNIILSDRYADSTIAYQCFGYGFNEAVYHQAELLYQLIADDFYPDLTIILDIDVKKGLERSKKRAGNNEQRFEAMDLSFHQNLKDGFLFLSRKYPHRYAVIDANRSIEEIHQDIITVVRERLGL
ncbi:MAG: dTMP kinase [Alphaproteobacteria bacterium]|nr:dTMP kinase [Alphaproteobacteria bacterium]MBQ6855065.1 dTMP kinase [Alphaproteobacteria bacterium]